MRKPPEVADQTLARAVPKRKSPFNSCGNNLSNISRPVGGDGQTAHRPKKRGFSRTFKGKARKCLRHRKEDFARRASVERDQGGGEKGAQTVKKGVPLHALRDGSSRGTREIQSYSPVRGSLPGPAREGEDTFIAGGCHWKGTTCRVEEIFISASEPQVI